MGIITLKKRPVSAEAILKELALRRILYEGHFRIQSGHHTNAFIVARRTVNAMTLHLQLINVFVDLDVDTADLAFLSMTQGSSDIMRGALRDTLRIDRRQMVHVDDVHGSMVIPEKSLDLMRTKKVVIIDDVVRKGRALKFLTALCGKHEIRPLSIIAAISSVGISAVNEVPITSLVRFPIKQWDSGQTCKLCQEGKIPLHDPYFFDR